jgi:hypothetical protein
MVNKAKQKRRLRKAFEKREKEVLVRAWRNLFVISGVLKG